MEKIYSKLNFPEEIKVNKIIQKEKFLESAKVDDDFKYIFEKYVEAITLKYCIKSNILNIPSYRTAEMDYCEIEVIQIDISNNLAIYDIATVVGRTIQYPVLLVMVKNNKFKLGIYRVRENKRSYNKNVVEDIVFTGWFNKDNLYGRIEEILSEMCFTNLKYKTIYDIHEEYYNKISSNHSKHIEIKELMFILKQLKIIDKKKLRNLILKECESVLLDDDELNTNRFDKNKLDKYKRTNSDTIMICKDEAIQFVWKYGDKKFRDFMQLDKLAEHIKKQKYLEKQALLKKHKTDCMYWDGKNCTNSTCAGSCYDAETCMYFRRYKQNYKYSPNMPIFQKIIKINNEENINNVKEGIVEYGDTVEILNKSTNERKQYIVFKLANGEIPALPKKCLEQKTGYYFVFKGNEYEIVNVVKNALEKSDELPKEIEVKDIPDLKDIVEYGDLIEILDISTNKVKKYEVKEISKGVMPLIPMMALNKSINSEIYIKDKKYKIINITRSK